MKNVYALILAGGEGTRFHPISTPERPKQFLNFIGSKTFIHHTYDRILPLVASERIFVSTNERYVNLVKEDLPGLPHGNIIAEPKKKNTAPALAYCMRVIKEHDQDAVVICLPSDHHIEDEIRFRETLVRAALLAREGHLITLGMKPTWASTDYGYIKIDPAVIPVKTGIQSICPVLSFVEKPNAALATEYFNSGNYLWNAGIFIWSVNSFMSELKKYAPEVAKPLDDYVSGPIFCRQYFDFVSPISIDYAIMEKTKKATVIPTSIGWSDVGSWDSVKNLIENGVEISDSVRSVVLWDIK